MNDMTDNLRTGLAALAEEAQPMDLRDRTLRTSRRLAVRRTVAATALAGVAVVLTTTVALALPSEQTVPPVPPASDGVPTVSTEPTAPTTEPSPPTTEPSPPPPAESSAPPVESQAPQADPEIPEAAMLQAEDLGPGHQTDDDTSQHHGSVSMLLAYCGATTAEEPLRSRYRALSSGDGGYMGQEEVLRYVDDDAAQVMGQVRGALPECQRIEVQGSPDHVSELTVLQEDFAGDESILLREVYTTPDGTVTRYQTVIRQGDLYAQVLLEVESEDRARAIATAAAQRLCEGTTTC